jgi:hypothetical protein
MKLACIGITWDFIIMSFYDVRQCGDREIISFADKFFLAHRYYSEGISGHIINPCLCICKEKDKFEPFRFIEVEPGVLRRESRIESHEIFLVT